MILLYPPPGFGGWLAQILRHACTSGGDLLGVCEDALAVLSCGERGGGGGGGGGGGAPPTKKEDF